MGDDQRGLDGAATCRVAVAPVSPVYLDRDASIVKGVSLIAEAAVRGAQIVAFPRVGCPAIYRYSSASVWVVVPVSSAESPTAMQVASAHDTLFRSTRSPLGPGGGAACWSCGLPPVRRTMNPPLSFEPTIVHTVGEPHETAWGVARGSWDSTYGPCHDLPFQLNTTPFDSEVESITAHARSDAHDTSLEPVWS